MDGHPFTLPFIHSSTRPCAGGGWSGLLTGGGARLHVAARALVVALEEEPNDGVVAEPHDVLRRSVRRARGQWCTNWAHDSARSGATAAKRKLYRVGPICETWPNTLTENPHEIPEVGPQFGPTLYNFRSMSSDDTDCSLVFH